MGDTGLVLASLDVSSSQSMRRYSAWRRETWRLSRICWTPGVTGLPSRVRLITGWRSWRNHFVRHGFSDRSRTADTGATVPQPVVCSRNSRAKQMAELDCWARQYAARGEKPFTGERAFLRYCSLFGIEKHSFRNQLVADIGCGPNGALHHFEAKRKFGVDVLARCFRPFAVEEHDIIYLAAPAEDLPFVDRYLDVVLSLNALDHVDGFEQAIREIYRVLKPEGEVHLAFNLGHPATLHEPQTLTQERVRLALRGLFAYHEPDLVRLPDCWADSAPSGVLVIQGTKAGRTASGYSEIANEAIRAAREGTSTVEQRDLEHALRLGASRTVIGDLWAAWAFRAWSTQDYSQAARAILRAFAAKPSHLQNRGMWSILVRSLCSRLGQ